MNIASEEIQKLGTKYTPRISAILVKGKLEEEAQTERIKAMVNFAIKKELEREDEKERGSIAVLLYECDSLNPNTPPKFAVVTYIPELQQVVYQFPEIIGAYNSDDYGGT